MIEISTLSAFSDSGKGERSAEALMSPFIIP
jgi:hypothetical protein